MDIFFSRSIGRFAFLGRSALAIVFLLADGLLFFKLYSGTSHSKTDLMVAVALSAPVALVAFYYFVHFAVISRLRSIRVSAWHALYMILPFVLGTLLFLKTNKLLIWDDLSIWNYVLYILALLILLFFFVLFMAPEEAAQGGVIQAILQEIEVGDGRFLIRLVPLVVMFVVIAGLYNFNPVMGFGGIYHGLNDAQSMDNAQLARQIARGEGYTTKFIRPYALTQLHNHALDQSVQTGGSDNLFPPELFPQDRQRILPDTYNAPGYPYVLAIWFRLVHADFNQTATDLSDHHIYTPDRWIPVLNLIFMFLTAALVFALGIRLFDDRVAWMALVIFVVSDMVWQYTLTALSTSLLMFLVTAVLFCAMEIFRVGEDCFESNDKTFGPAWLWGLALSLLLGFTCLTRLPLLALLVPLLIMLFLMPRASFFLGPLVALIVIGFVGPWFWHMYKISGNPLGSNVPLLLYGVDDDYKGNQIYCATSIPSYERLFKDLSKKEYLGFRWHFERAWDLLGSNPMIVLCVAACLHRFKRRRVQVFLWLLLGCAIALVLAGNLGEANPEPISAWNTIVLLFPSMLVVGTAFFFVLLDRLFLQLWLLNNIIVTGVMILTAIPMVLTISTAPSQYFNFPPYMPPIIKVLGGLTAPNEWITTDMPWASAWYADHASLWLPDSVTEFENINDSICPSGLLYFTPVTWSQPASNLTSGEYKDWLPFVMNLNMPPVSGGNVPSIVPAGFPLSVGTRTPAGGPDYYIWSDRPRWNAQ